MRKCRKLADKIKIFTLAVLVAASAFFYAPMEVSAEELSFDVGTVSGVNTTQSAISVSGYYAKSYGTVAYSTPFSAYDFDDNTYYKITMSGRSDVYLYKNSGCTSANTTVVNVTSQVLYFDNGFVNIGGGNQTKTNFALNFSDVSFVLLGSDLESHSLMHRFTLASSSSATLYTKGTLSNFSFTVEPLSSAEAGEYQDGYDAGYSDGLEVGENNGYSSGFSDGYSEGQQSGYDEGFSSGYDEGFSSGGQSVDTQSYYDAGYSAGYDSGYLTGYDEGYDVGYSSGYDDAMARFDGWGADTSDYPILLETLSNDGDYTLIDSSSMFPYSTRGWLFLGKFITDLNPSHTYKLVFDSSKVKIYESDIIYSEFDLNYRIGNNSYKWYFGENFYYISGSDMSSSVFLDVDLFGVESVLESDAGQLNLEFDYINVYLYDMGPSGDTQNHIANQTDSLTNGFDNSQGNSVNDNLSSGLNEYSDSENTLWATATTGLKDFTFFDFASVPAMITGMSFVGSIMGSWFNNAGGASGVGIVLSILFSVMLVAMVLGLYRWYQSRGGKGGS